MGTQAIINRADLLLASVRFQTNNTVALDCLTPECHEQLNVAEGFADLFTGTCPCCGGSDFSRSFFAWRMVMFPNDVNMADYGSDSFVQIDFNKGRGNRELIEPWLIKNKIEYREV